MKKTEARATRDETFWKVLNSALELDFKRGHLKWTMSELSRKSGITRSLIYYHFGRSKAAILTEAIQVIGDELIGMSPERMDLWRDGQWAVSLNRARAVAEQCPSLICFYFMHRERPTEVGEGLRAVDKRFIEKQSIFFSGLSQAERVALYAFFFGLTFYPLTNAAAIDAGIASLKALIKRA
jgi:AcrR family transcriptional regulator